MCDSHLENSPETGDYPPVDIVIVGSSCLDPNWRSETICSPSRWRQETKRSKRASRKRASSARSSTAAIMVPLMLFTLNCVGISNTNAATSTSRHSLNHGVNSWTNSPKHAAATMNASAYSDVSQPNWEFIKADMSLSESMRRFAARQNAAANAMFSVLVPLFFGALLCLFRRKR